MTPTQARRFSPIVGAFVVLAVALSGCASSTGGATTTVADNSRLDSYAMADLLPTSTEVKDKLGWSVNSNFVAPAFAGSPKNIAAFINSDASGLSLSAKCRDTLRASGAIPLLPIGAVDGAGNEWVERNVTIRDLQLTRYRSTAAAASQVSGLPATIKACPPFSVPGGGKLSIVPSGVAGVLIFQDGISYSWVVASYGDLVAVVEVGNGSKEHASGKALVNLQIEKLKQIAAGKYK